MVTEMLSHWPVRVLLPLGAADRDAGEYLTDDAIVRLFGEVRAAYGAVCSPLDLGRAAVRDVVVQRGVVPVPGQQVTVSVAVVEVFPDSFTMDARIRPAEGPGVAASATCVVAPAGGEVTPELKAAMISLAQSARFMH